MVFENITLRKMQVLTRKNKKGKFGGKLHYEILYELRSSINIIDFTIPSKIRWAGHVARIATKKIHAESW
jgi:hypothetical protein